MISDIHGVSGRAMLDAIIAGERNPRTLAQLARGTMRGKIRQLEEALDCSFLTGEHAAVLTMMLATIDYYTARIEELTVKIDVLCEPYEHQIAQLDAVPGIGVITAQDIIAEIGSGMTVFPTAAHLVSWAAGARRSPSPAASAREPTPPAAATATCQPPSAKPPSAPDAPSPSSARNTAAWSSGCPREKPSSPPGTPC